MSFISVNNIVKNFEKNQILKNISFSMNQGEQLSLQGASGSGKSTLLYILGGLDTPDSGQVIIGDQKINELGDEKLAIFRNEMIGFIFQFHFLLPSMNALENILLPARIGGHDISNIKKRALELSSILKVDALLKKNPYQLSGGEQQRINIIRALSLRPKVLLCDEPTGNLDSVNSNTVIELILHLAKQMGTTLIIVSHDRDIAMRLERKISIEDGQIIG